MTWWLVLFVLIDGQWVPGADLTPEGWSPRAYDTREECMERRDFAEESLADLRNVDDSKWFCTRDRDAALSELEAEAGQ